MWRKLKKQIAVEEEALEELIEFHRSLIDECHETEPTGTDLSALAAFLHSFYNGVENVFRRITIELGDEMPENDDWHKQLLRAMTQATEQRPAVITEELRERLNDFLGFRHVFRNIYLYRLRWSRMDRLVLTADDTLHELKDELATFVDRMEDSIEGAETVGCRPC